MSPRGRGSEGATPARRRGARGRAAACALALLSSSCAAALWTPRAARPTIPLQWPYQPAAARLTFDRSLTGFSRERGGAAALRSVVYGKAGDDAHAFVLPVAVATAADGRIAVADRGRNCVHLFVPTTQSYLCLTGPEGGRLVSPVGVIFDEEMDLFVSDSSAGRVLAFGPGGDLLFTLTAAGGEILARPTGLAYSPRRKLLYVVDTLAHRIHAFTTRGEHVQSFGGRGEGRGQFNFPTHIFWAEPGEIYVTNSLGFRVDILDEAGTPLASFGHHGDGSGDLAMPKGVAVDQDGVIYVADSIFDNVQLFSRAGDFLLTLGARGIDFGEFWLPAGMFISDRNELFVCDTYNRRVQVFTIARSHAQPLS